MRGRRPPQVGLQPADRVPVDDRDLLPADSTAPDTGQVIEIGPVLRDAKEPHPARSARP